jgi:hypothetical protein
MDAPVAASGVECVRPKWSSDSTLVATAWGISRVAVPRPLLCSYRFPVSTLVGLLYRARLRSKKAEREGIQSETFPAKTSLRNLMCCG